MKTETIDKLKKLTALSKSLDTYFDMYRKKTCAGSCDKYAAGFNIDNRFTVFKVEASFNAYLGYYGNSSCSTFSNGISSDQISQYFIAALNRHKELIFKTMAEDVKTDAVLLREGAEKELRALQDMLQHLSFEEAGG